jgi:AraC-like DNA-binding protein
MLRTAMAVPPRSAATDCVRPDSTVSMPVVRALVDLAERAGAERTLLLRDASFDPVRLHQHDARATRTDLYRLCEAMLARTGRPDLGLYCAEHVMSQVYNPVADLAYHSATLRESMHSVLRYQRLLADDCNLRVFERERSAVVACATMIGASLEVERFISELVLASVCRRIRQFHSHAPFEMVAFTYPAPGYQQRYQQLFRVEPCFAQRFTGVVFPLAWMDARSPVANADLHRALSAFGDRKLAQTNRDSPLSERVRGSLLSQTSLRKVEMQVIARELGLSERSLRRHLLGEGTTFAIILDSVLAQSALACLVDRQRSIQETADELGFGDRTAFHRAFRRWTGTTPSELQRARKLSKIALQRPCEDHACPRECG